MELTRSPLVVPFAARRDHLGWLALACALAVALLAPRAVFAADVTVLQRSGELLIVKEDARTPTQDKTLPEDTRVQSGPVPEASARGALQDKPPAHAAALYFGPGQVVTLVTGASAVRTGGDAAPSYTLTGAAHLLFDAGSDGPREFVLNGVRLRARRLQLFFNGLTNPPTAQVLTGEADLAGEGQTGTAGRGQTIVLDPKQPRIEGERLGAGEPLPDDPLRAWATLAGFEAPGPFRRVGDAVPSDGRLRVNRNERISHITGERVVVFEGDQLVSEDGQKVRVEFDSGDKVRLTNKTVFKIDEYLPENREKPSMLFTLLGRVRALVVSRMAPDAVRFKTGTATIGVKGTDLNMIADEAATTVETVEGTVGVSDAAGAGEVTVGQGLQTSVPAGALPAEPSPIPPERLQELQAESLADATVAAAAAPAAAAAAAVVPTPAATAVTIQQPAPGQAVRQVTLAYTVEPADAPVEVLLDGQLLDPKPEPGTSLPNPPDGAHTLVLRGIGDGAPQATVAFTVDTVPPAVTSALEAITVPGEGVTLTFNEPVREVALTLGGATIPVALAPDGLSGSVAADPSTMTPEPTAFTLRLIDAAGNTADAQGQLAIAAAAPPPPPPAAPAQAATPPTAGDPCAQLRTAYYDSIATKTGDPIDDRYVDTRGLFACAGISRAPGADGVPADVPYQPERSPAAGTASQLDETFLNDLR